MAKQEQVLIIDPVHELKFRGPFTAPVTSYMKLLNPSNNKVCFKIKTTAPKKYCVRPNSGVLDPKEMIEIAVSLQPFEFNPTEKNKHKFMVQTMIPPEGEVNYDALWKELTPENSMDSKLKCVFEMPPVAAEENTPVSPNAGVPSVTEAPSMAHDGDLVKAATEVKQLREEESFLRQENLQLKEKLMFQERMRLMQGTTNSQGSGTFPPSSNPSMASAQGLSPLVIITAIIMTIIGVILGKYIL